MRLISLFFSFILMSVLACSTSDSSLSSLPEADFSGTKTVESLKLVAGETKTMAPGASITVTKASETLDGTLSFQGGTTLIFDGDVTLNGAFSGTTSDSVIIVAKGKLTFGTNFQHTAANSIKIVSDITDAQSDDEIISDSAVDKGASVDGNIVGNLPPASPIAPSTAPQKAIPSSKQAQRLPSWKVNGSFAPNPRDRTKPFVFLLFPKNRDVEFVDVNIKVPDALKGKDENKEGTAKGGDAEQKAPSIRINVPGGKFTANKFTVQLANGGKGGDGTATPTQTLCDTTATGGKGGPSGNLKITAQGEIEILSMTITPGKSGDGGKATATGCTRPQCSKKVGGTATATGGAGADNKKILTTRGVTNPQNITINAVIAGNGGDAIATGGKGSDDDPAGYAGGIATAMAGKGGIASITGASATTTDGKDGTKTATNGTKGANITCTTTTGGDTGASSFVAGSYTGNGGCGISSTTVSVSGSNVTLTPFGSGVASQSFTVNGSAASATGVTVFSQPNHTVTLSASSNSISMNATNPSGGACSETLTKQ